MIQLAQVTAVVTLTPSEEDSTLHLWIVQGFTGSDVLLALSTYDV